MSITEPMMNRTCCAQDCMNQFPVPAVGSTTIYCETHRCGFADCGNVKQVNLDGCYVHGKAVATSAGLMSFQAQVNDPWANLGTYACRTCRFFVPKDRGNGRCRRHAPTLEGYPVVYTEDWCGDHKLGTNPSRTAS